MSLINLVSQILNKIITRQTYACYKNIIHHDQVGFIVEMHGLFNLKLINTINHKNGPTDKNHIIKQYIQKRLRKIQLDFMIKVLERIGLKGI